MSIYEPVLVFLDGVINEFKDEFKRANATVEELCFLEGFEINRLLKSNTRVLAALTVKGIIADEESMDEPNQAEVTRTIGHLLNEAVKVGNYPAISLYERVLKTMNQTAAH